MTKQELDNYPLEEELSQDRIRELVPKYLKEIRNKFRGRIKVPLIFVLGEPQGPHSNVEHFTKGGWDYAAERHEQIDYFEIVLTRFPQIGEGSQVISEGVRFRTRKPHATQERNVMDYHKRTLDKNNIDARNTQSALDRIQGFIDSIE